MIHIYCLFNSAAKLKKGSVIGIKYPDRTFKLSDNPM